MNDNNMNNEYGFNNEEYHYTLNPYAAETEKLPQATKKKKGRTAAKITAFFMAMALVSGGSIAAYREFAPGSSDSSSSSSEMSVSAPKKSGNALSAEKLSIINADDTGDTPLTTEEIVEKVLPSVVGIESKFTYAAQNNSYYFGFGSNAPGSSTAAATGTGVIITSDGYIVTNAHVIYDTQYGAGLSDDISVLTGDGNSYDAKVIGYDTDSDIAVLKIDAEGLDAAEFGDSDSLRLGEDVVAIGNPLGFELMNTVTRGIISGKDRQISINDQSMELLQTDTAINSGNSGGPLINKYGQVIGINSSKMSSNYSGEASIEGIGFAIPSNAASRIVNDLMEFGFVTGKPQFGISCQDVTEAVSQMYGLPVGVYVTSVSEKSAADRAGLHTGDIIIAADGTQVRTSTELNAIKNKHTAGETVEITYIRGESEKTIEVILDETEHK